MAAPLLVHMMRPWMLGLTGELCGGVDTGDAGNGGAMTTITLHHRCVKGTVARSVHPARGRCRAIAPEYAADLVDCGSATVQEAGPT